MADTFDDQSLAAERRALAQLTTDALIDDVLGLRADLADAQAAAKKQAAEILALREHLKSFQGDQAEVIRRQILIIEHKSREVFKANDKAAAALSQVRALERKIRTLEAREIPL